MSKAKVKVRIPRVNVLQLCLDVVFDITLEPFQLGIDSAGFE